jgi:hypothetical protein
VYTTSYLALTYRGQCNEKINFAHGLGFAPFKPPYSFGAAKSSVWRMLAKGHHEVRLTDAELRTLACWITTSPCRSAARTWSITTERLVPAALRVHVQQARRVRVAGVERGPERLRQPPVAADRLYPERAESRRQKYWSE